MATRSLLHVSNDSRMAALKKIGQLENLLGYAGRTRLAIEIEEKIAGLKDGMRSVEKLSRQCSQSFGRSDREESGFRKLQSCCAKLTKLAM